MKVRIVENQVLPVVEVKLHRGINLADEDYIQLMATKDGMDHPLVTIWPESDMIRFSPAGANALGLKSETHD